MLYIVCKSKCASLTIVNIIVNNIFFLKRSFFQKPQFLKKQSNKKRSQIVFIKRSFPKSIVIHFLKVQNEWVILKNDHFYHKTIRLFLKSIEKLNKKRSFNDRFQKRLTTLMLPQQEQPNKI